MTRYLRGCFPEFVSSLAYFLSKLSDFLLQVQVLVAYRERNMTYKHGANHLSRVFLHLSKVQGELSAYLLVRDVDAIMFVVDQSLQ